MAAQWVSYKARFAATRRMNGRGNVTLLTLMIGGFFTHRSRLQFGYVLLLGGVCEEALNLFPILLLMSVYLD